MKTKFTPGPWHLTEYSTEFTIDKTPYFGVGSVNSRPGRPLAGPLCKEDAALIAAAPDMYKALFKAQVWFEGQQERFKGELPIDEETFNTIHDALMKARGEK